MYKLTFLITAWLLFSGIGFACLTGEQIDSINSIANYTGASNETLIELFNMNCIINQTLSEKIFNIENSTNNLNSSLNSMNATINFTDYYSKNDINNIFFNQSQVYSIFWSKGEFNTNFTNITETIIENERYQVMEEVKLNFSNELNKLDEIMGERYYEIKTNWDLRYITNETLADFQIDIKNWIMTLTDTEYAWMKQIGWHIMISVSIICLTCYMIFKNKDTEKFKQLTERLIPTGWRPKSRRSSEELITNEGLKSQRMKLIRLKELVAQSKLSPISKKEMDENISKGIIENEEELKKEIRDKEIEDKKQYEIDLEMLEIHKLARSKDANKPDKRRLISTKKKKKKAS